MACNGTKFGKLTVVAHGQNQVVARAWCCVVGGHDLKHLVGHDVLVRIARSARYFAADEVVGAQIGQHGNLGVQQGHVHLLAFSGTFGVTQCRQNGDCGVHASEQIGHGHPHFLGAATQIIAFSGDAHQATNALHGVIVACAFAVRAGLAKARHAAINQLGVEGAQAGVV